MPGSPFEPFRQKVILGRQPRDLGVKLLELRLGRAALPPETIPVTPPVAGGFHVLAGFARN